MREDWTMRSPAASYRSLLVAALFLPPILILLAARQSGISNLQEIIQDKAFDPIRNDPPFVEFMRGLT